MRQKNLSGPNLVTLMDHLLGGSASEFTRAISQDKCKTGLSISAGQDAEISTRDLPCGPEAADATLPDRNARCPIDAVWNQTPEARRPQARPALMPGSTVCWLEPRLVAPGLFESGNAESLDPCSAPRIKRSLPGRARRLSIVFYLDAENSNRCASSFGVPRRSGRNAVLATASALAQGRDNWNSSPNPPQPRALLPESGEPYCLNLATRF
jgi:hypothetical protein